MTRMTRASLMLLTSVALAASLAGCGSDDEKTSGVTHITVRDEQPVGGIAQIKVAKGEQVRFTVQSDSAQEVHVHGYDIERELPAGTLVNFVFPAKIDGSFEIELEEPGVQIASLSVTP